MRLLSLLSLFPIVKGIIKGISLGSGLETNNRNVDCYWKHDASYYISQLSTLGFNSVRVPFSNQYIQENDFTIMDRIFDLTEMYNMTILLDFHRVYNSHQGDIFEISKEELIKSWIKLLDRYNDREHLTSVGVWNEYQKDDVMFWNGYLRDVITTLERKYPNRFVYYASGVRWSGSLNGMNLEDLEFKDRIRYELHKYRFSSSNNWRQDWDWSVESGVPKDRIVIGEFGWFSNVQDDVQWANSFIDYLKEKEVRDTYFWLCASSSSDTGGIYFNDCETIEWSKVNLLKKLWE